MIKLADFYEVDIRELLEGQRRNISPEPTAKPGCLPSDGPKRTQESSDGASPDDPSSTPLESWPADRPDPVDQRPLPTEAVFLEKEDLDFGGSRIFQKEPEERKNRNQQMNEEMKETAALMADYDAHLQKRMLRQLHLWCWIGLACMIVYMGMDEMGWANGSEWEQFLAGFPLGVITGILILGVLYTGRFMKKIAAWKQQWRHSRP